MTDLKTEVHFHLSTPLSYAAGGEQREGTFITLVAPSSKHVKHCAPLKQAFMRAIKEQAQDAETEAKQEEVTFSADEVIHFLAASSAVDFEHVLQCGAHLLTTKGIAKVEGEVNLTMPLLEQVSMDDFEMMVGTYLANFTLRSVLTSLKSA